MHDIKSLCQIYLIYFPILTLFSLFIAHWTSQCNIMSLVYEVKYWINILGTQSCIRCSISRCFLLRVINIAFHFELWKEQIVSVCKIKCYYHRASGVEKNCSWKLGASLEITSLILFHRWRNWNPGKASHSLKVTSSSEWIRVYVWLSPFAVHLRLSQHC